MSKLSDCESSSPRSWLAKTIHENTGIAGITEMLSDVTFCFYWPIPVMLHLV